MYKKRKVPIGRAIDNKTWELNDAAKKATFLISKEKFNELPEEIDIPEKVLVELNIPLSAMGLLYEFPEAAGGTGYVFSYELYDRSTGQSHETAIAFDQPIEFPNILRKFADDFEEASRLAVKNSENN